MPSNAYIMCVHGSGYVIIELPDDAEMANVDIYQNGVSICSAMITTDSNRIDFPPVSGEVFIRITIPWHGTYSGILKY